VDAALIGSEPRGSELDDARETPTLACALAVEEKAARRGGAPVARVGLGGSLPAPAAALISFGLAGALVEGLEPGTVVTAWRIVDEHGVVVWEGEPLAVPGARSVVLCAVGRVIDEPAERGALATRTGAVAADMESGVLAATGRLVGVVRAISDGPERPVGRLASAAHADGDVAWWPVVRAFLNEPAKSARAAAGSRRALAELERASRWLAEGGA
jgi:hypothetical protein